MSSTGYEPALSGAQPAISQQVEHVLAMGQHIIDYHLKRLSPKPYIWPPGQLTHFISTIRWVFCAQVSRWSIAIILPSTHLGGY